MMHDGEDKGKQNSVSRVAISYLPSSRRKVAVSVVVAVVVVVVDVDVAVVVVVFVVVVVVVVVVGFVVVAEIFSSNFVVF